MSDPHPEIADYAALLREGVRALKAAGVPDPARDARWLLREAARVEAAGLAILMPAPVEGAVAERFFAMIRERAARRPVSHILGVREFYGRCFSIDARALDPRPESETLVDAALARLGGSDTARILDLGVGSGCLLLSVLAERPQTTGVGVDQSAAALQLAAENAKRLDASNTASGARPIGPRLELRLGNWLEGVDERFDLILCNPPYIDEEEWLRLEPEVRDHEPKGALTPGSDGLCVYRKLAPLLASRLASDGVGLFEVGRGQARDVGRIFADHDFETELLKDLGGAERVVAIRRLLCR